MKLHSNRFAPSPRRVRIFAAKKGIPLVCIVGDDERQARSVTLRDLRTGQQETLAVQAAVARARILLANADPSASITEIC